MILFILLIWQIQIMNDKRQNKVEKTRIIQKNWAIQILNKTYNFTGAKVRKPTKWLMDVGWGERALCIVRVQLTTPYSSNIKEQNLTSRELEPTRKLKNLEQRILSLQLRSFMASLIFAYLYLYVLFYSYSWLLFSAFYWFILLMNQYTWYDLIQTEVDDSLLCLFCKSHKRDSEQLNSSFFEPDTIMFIIILIIITTNIYWVLTICYVLLHVFYMYYLI